MEKKVKFLFFYQCGMKRSTKCSASVVLNKLDDKWWPQNLSGDDVHNHVSDKGAILAEVMKKEMFQKVAKNPETRSDDVYRNVIVDYERHRKVPGVAVHTA